MEKEIPREEAHAEIFCFLENHPKNKATTKGAVIIHKIQKKDINLQMNIASVNGCNPESGIKDTSVYGVRSISVPAVSKVAKIRYPVHISFQNGGQERHGKTHPKVNIGISIPFCGKCFPHGKGCFAVASKKLSVIGYRKITLNQILIPWFQ